MATFRENAKEPVPMAPSVRRGKEAYAAICAFGRINKNRDGKLAILLKLQLGKEHNCKYHSKESIINKICNIFCVRAETAKEYQAALAERDAENARLRTELEKFKTAEKRN